MCLGDLEDAVPAAGRCPGRAGDGRAAGRAGSNSDTDGRGAVPGCGRSARRVHGYRTRRLPDGAGGGRRVVVELRIRRLVCDTRGCARQTFGEQVPPVAARCARRTFGLAALITDIAVVLASRSGAAKPARPAVQVSRITVLRLLMAVPTRAGAGGAERRRSRAAPEPPVRDAAHRRGHPLPHRRAARPQGRHAHGLAARAPRGADRVPGRVGSLCRGHPSRCLGRGAGRRPVATCGTTSPYATHFTA